ncbi:hypothetical protein D0T85_13165 [Bacteroides sp. 519]|nr:hypothetical protein [Bacteroides sp. 519]
MIGIEKSDSIANIFSKIRETVFLDTLKYQPEVNLLVKFDKFRRVLLEYNISDGLHIYCLNESLVLSDYPFLKDIDNICRLFCQQQNLSKMVFSCTVYQNMNFFKTP